MQPHPIDRGGDLLAQAGVVCCCKQISLQGQVQQLGNGIEDQDIRIQIEHLFHRFGQDSAGEQSVVHGLGVMPEHGSVCKEFFTGFTGAESPPEAAAVLSNRFEGLRAHMRVDQPDGERGLRLGLMQGPEHGPQGFKIVFIQRDEDIHRHESLLCNWK